MERRAHQRKETRCTAEVFDNENNYLACGEARNISPGGIAILTRRPFRDRDTVKLNITDGKSPIMKNIKGEIARVEHLYDSVWHNAVKFTREIPVDSVK